LLIDAPANPSKGGDAKLQGLNVGNRAWQPVAILRCSWQNRRKAVTQS